MTDAEEMRGALILLALTIGIGAGIYLEKSKPAGASVEVEAAVAENPKSPSSADKQIDPDYDFFAENHRQYQTFVCPDPETIEGFNRLRAQGRQHVTSSAFVALKWGVCRLRPTRLGDSEIMLD